MTEVYEISFSDTARCLYYAIDRERGFARKYWTGGENWQWTVTVKYAEQQIARYTAMKLSGNYKHEIRRV